MGHNGNAASKPGPPKKPLTAFFIYMADVFQQLKNENPEASSVNITKMIADKWRDLDGETRQPYEIRHQQEREKYEREVKEYEAKNNPNEKKREPFRRENDSDERDEEQHTDEEEKEKDTGKSIYVKLPVNQQNKPAPPRRPLTAFFIFKNDIFDEVKKNNPEARITEIIKIISERWKGMDEQSKLQYEKKFNESKEKYEKELKEYVEKFGPIEKRRRRPFRDQNGGSSNQEEAEDNDRKVKKSNLLQDDEDEDEDDDLGEPCNKVFI